MKRPVLFSGILLMSIVLFACTPNAAPVEKPGVPQPMPRGPQAGAKKSWVVEWEKTLAQARKEGKVVVYGGSTVAALKLHATKLLAEKFGISAGAVRI